MSLGSQSSARITRAPLPPHLTIELFQGSREPNTIALRTARDSKSGRRQSERLDSEPLALMMGLRISRVSVLPLMLRACWRSSMHSPTTLPVDHHIERVALWPGEVGAPCAEPDGLLAVRRTPGNPLVRRKGRCALDLSLTKGCSLGKLPSPDVRAAIALIYGVTVTWVILKHVLGNVLKKSGMTSESSVNHLVSPGPMSTPPSPRSVFLVTNCCGQSVNVSSKKFQPKEIEYTGACDLLTTPKPNFTWWQLWELKKGAHFISMFTSDKRSMAAASRLRVCFCFSACSSARRCASQSTVYAAMAPKPPPYPFGGFSAQTLKNLRAPPSVRRTLMRK